MARLLALLASLTLLLCLAVAQSVNQTSVYDDSDKYSYYGCYNETTGIADSTHARALADGINEVKRGEMTVPLCLAFCGEGDTQYQFAGLEWSRECWCSQSISGISAKLDDKECSFPCEGNSSMACGGALKLTVYIVSGAAGVAVPGLLLISGLVLALIS